MDNLIANNLYGWFSSLIRRVKLKQPPNSNNDIDNDVFLDAKGSLTSSNPNQLLNQDENSKHVLSANSDCETTTYLFTLNTRGIINTSKMEKKSTTTSSNDDNSIEEDIEEVITAEDEEEEEEGGAVLSHVHQQSLGKDTKVQNVSLEKQKLFELDPGVGASFQFTIDNAPLSGASLAKHFQPKHSPESMRKTDEESTRRDETTASQRTENDVSEIDDASQLFVRSLDFKTSLLNVDPRDCISLDSPVRVVLQPRPGQNDSDENDERDHSLEEVICSNHSIEITLNEGELSSLDPNVDIDNESQINKILGDTQSSLRSEKSLYSAKGNEFDLIGDENSASAVHSKSDKNSTKSINKSETDEDDMSDLKKKILSLPANGSSANVKTSGHTLMRDASFEQNENQAHVVKRMERVEGDFTKEALDDITEESEKVSQQCGAEISAAAAAIDNDNTSNDFDSIISLNMIQMLENKVRDLQEIVASKDVCLTSLNMQLDSAHRRELFATNAASTENRDSLRDLPPSGRDSSSLATTTSTEYRTIHEDIVPRVFDFHAELIQRDHLIEKLTDSLQQSVHIREQLQNQSEKLSSEVQQLRKQLADTLEHMKKPYWPRDQESSTTGQRLSEISIDLVSESDDDLERQFLTDNEEKMSISNRNSRERQLGGDSTTTLGGVASFETFETAANPFCVSKQLEQFQKYLNPDEVRIFFMVQKKYDDFLSQEIEKVKMKNENEVKVLIEQLENEKCEKELEINRLRQLISSVKNGSTELDQLRKELDMVHSLEMEKLRTYFEKKCADLEKQYSEEVFSQKSQRMSGDSSGSDVSDQEMIQDDNHHTAARLPIGKKRSLEELFASPLHRQLTPTTLDCLEKDPNVTVEELKNFYREKICEISQKYEENLRRLKGKLRRFESKYADDEFMKKSPTITEQSHRQTIAFAGGDIGSGGGGSGVHDIHSSSSDLIIDQDEIGINESQEIRQIAAEYDRRLQEQVNLAKQDLVRELENQIQALLSETTTDDNHWPPELILLREKFTAKSQLEIAQLQIKHEEEMSRLKVDYEKQLKRKNKRNSAFDLSRDLDQIINERDNLRELSTTFRYLLYELAKCVSFCEEDLNTTFLEELQKYGVISNQADHNVSEGGDNEQCSGRLNLSTQSNQQLHDKISKTIRLVPDVSGLLALVEDPTLIDFIADNYKEGDFKLQECLEKLKSEANGLLVLSEKLNKYREKHDDTTAEKRDSCEEEDGLKAAPNRPAKLDRANSLNESMLHGEKVSSQNALLSLPVDISRMEITAEQLGKEEIYSANISTSELNVTLNELQNRFVKSECDRLKLAEDLKSAITKNQELGAELKALRDQLKLFDSSQREDLSEGYGISDIQSPPRLRGERNAGTSFSQLQDKARNLLSTPTKNMSENTTLLLQLIEEFCREGDNVVDGGKRDREDLQAQIDAADKKLKDTRQFLDIQAADREAERDEFIKEIEKLKLQIREKEKERVSFEIASKEFEQMEQQIRDLTQQESEYEAQKDKLEIELKASIDKIFVLREIITDLETQVDSKSINENVLNEKVKELEAFIASQAHSNETLQHEVESLKSEIGHGYQERIAQLEEQLRNTRSNSEQNIAIEQFTEQLRDIETTLDQKTKILESLHAANSNSLSDNFSEDVSVPNLPKDINPSPQTSPINTPRHHSLPVDEVQRVFQKLSKHTRVEEAAIKRIKDLEMQVAHIRSNYGELENERKTLQEKMTEQVMRISSLQTKLDEQRRRAEELNRQGTSDFAARIHDLQSEVYNLKETLSAREKQIVNLKNHLEQSKATIDRHEAELVVTIQGDPGRVERLEVELKGKLEEIKQLKEKMKKEMINKLALPDLMETMLADKNEEIDHLKEQLDRKEKELQGILNINLAQNETSSKEKDKSNEQGDGSKGSGRTLSDIVSISEYDEPDVIRRAATAVDSALEFNQATFPEKTMDTSKCATIGNTTDKRSGDISMFDLPVAPNAMRTFDPSNFFMATASSSKLGTNSTPSFAPRQINFSEFADDTKTKESTPKIIEVTEAEGEEIESLRKLLKSTEDRAESFKISLEAVESEKNAEIGSLKTELQSKTEMYEQLVREKTLLEEKILDTAKLEADMKANATILDDLNRQLTESESKISVLENMIEEKSVEIADLKATIAKKTDSTTDYNEKILGLNHQIHLLNTQIKQKDDILSKYEKNLINSQENEKMQMNRLANMEEEKEALRAELDLVRAQLSENILSHQKTLLDVESFAKMCEKLQEELITRNDEIKTMGVRLNEADDVATLRQKIQDLSKHNAALQVDLERLRSQNSDSKPYSLDEIAEKVEKELNYSAQLDSNILKAIESEEESNLHTHRKNGDQPVDNNLMTQLDALKCQLEAERKGTAHLQEQLNEVRAQTQDIQQQDADIIEAMRLRLTEAMEKETELHNILDDEREKCERLSNQLSILQRTEARKSTLLQKSPPESPRKVARAAEEAEAGERLKEEIKLVKSQNERERERVNDLQKVLEREKNRFEKELSDRVEYGEKLKRELDKVNHDKALADEEVEHLQERLTSATREIETLEARISTLQEAETRRAYRRGKERVESTQNAVEIQEMRSKILQLESERDHLNEVIKLLREDVERGAKREAKLAEALSNAGSDNSIPEQFIQKLKEMNILLSENAKENRQMAETLQYLTDERKLLQRKCEELETICQTGALATNTLTEMEERANHLFGKYLRVESHRKALVHQKRYLMIVLQSYQDSEAKALNLLNGGEPRRRKRKSFKSVALIVIAIERMKFIVRRWHTGKIVVSKSIFNLASQKRLLPSHSGPNGNIVTRPGKSIFTSVSPPVRDRGQNERQNFSHLLPRPPLQAPSLISECTDKLDWTNRWK